MKIVSGDQMRAIEKTAIERLGIPSILLMENAALAIAKKCLEFLNGKARPKVAIFCGGGNNGGDGLALARLLFCQNVIPTVFTAGGAPKGDPAVYMEIVKNLKIPVVELSDSLSQEVREKALQGCAQSDLVVDALLGTGLKRNVSGSIACVIEIINAHAKHVISVDMPSGVASDSGEIMGVAVKAAETVTLGYPKIGLYAYPGAGFAGTVHIERITLPPHITEIEGGLDIKGRVITEKDARSMLPARPARSNKGSFGKALVAAGSREMPGAACLAVSAAYMAGCGLVAACALENVAQAIINKQSEVITRLASGKDGMFCKEDVQVAAREMQAASAALVGPGIGRGSGAADFARELICYAGEREIPLVLDADALFALTGAPDILKTLKIPAVITPHPGEMARLAGIPVKHILERPLEVALDFSRAYNVVTLLKDARTVVANPAGEFFINTSGNSALAKAGTGDVLAGLIAGFAAQGMCPCLAAAFGAYIHGRAGEEAAREKSRYGVAAGDLLKYIPAVLLSLETSLGLFQNGYEK